MVVVQNQLQRSAFANAVLAFIPDLLIAWVAATYFEGGLIGFVLTFFGLQLVYTAIWAKNSLWLWFMYYVSNRRKMIDHFGDYLVQKALPKPPAYIDGAEAYFRQIMENEELECSQRIVAAVELATMNGFRVAGRYQILLQTTMSMEEAIRNYGRSNQGAIKPKKAAPPREDEEVTIIMKADDLQTIAWLADWGLRIWIESGDGIKRFGEQLPFKRAERYSNLLETFERKMVPELLLEPGEEKEVRFNRHENRFKNLWACYPEQYKS